jgi:hypothetical protein
MGLRIVMLLKALLRIEARRWEKYFDLTGGILAYQDGAKKITPKRASRFVALYCA